MSTTNCGGSPRRECTALRVPLGAITGPLPKDVIATAVQHPTRPQRRNRNPVRALMAIAADVAGAIADDADVRLDAVPPATASR